MALAAYAVSASAEPLAGHAAPSPQSDSGPSTTTIVSGVTITAPKPDYSQQPGAAIGDIRPELQLGPDQIQAYGATTLGDLLDALKSKTRSDQGRGGEQPVLLLNGRRVSDLKELRDIPSEAILRVDILPEEVSLKYGYAAGQRVVNFVLRPNFRALIAEVSSDGATEGAGVTDQAELDLARIHGDDRLNLDLKYKGALGVTDADRDIVEPAVDAAARSLVPATQDLTVNAVLAHPIGDGIGATFNASLDANSSDSLQGPSGPGLAGAPLHQYIDGWTGHLGATFDRDIGQWTLSLTSAYDHADTQTDTDLGPASVGGARPQATARSIADSANAQFLVNGPLLKLPAGDLAISAKIGDSQAWQSSTSSGQGAFQSVRLNRNDAGAQVSIDLPLASRRRQALAFLGDLSLNANAAVDRLSDFGTLTTLGYGLNWTPLTGYSLIASHTRDETAPTMAQLGGPTISTPGVRVFDYATGQTADVSQITGGNPGLTHDSRSLDKIGLTIQPWQGRDLTLTTEYIHSDIAHAIETFPAASVAIQAAFPDRFVRDDAGALVEEDLRAVNFAQAEKSELRWGIDYDVPIGGGRQRGKGDWLGFAVRHTLYFTDRVLIRPGGPTLDFLGGSAATGTGGQYRNEIEGEVLAGRGGFRAALTADWRQSTFARDAAGAPAGNLYFSGVTLLNLRLFDVLDKQPRIVARHPWLRGTQITFEVTNLLDQWIQARDATGATPLIYQPGYIDPLGRVVSLTVRKLFR